MEEKERKQLKKRLLGLVINEPPYPYPITMAEVMVNDMSKPNLKPLLNFVEQELDRAREEVIKNLIKKIEEANCDSISLEFLREIDLSKLTTK